MNVNLKDLYWCHGWWIWPHTITPFRFDGRWRDVSSIGQDDLYMFFCSVSL